MKARVVRVSPQTAKGAALHLRYIERDGVERDGSPGTLYGPTGPERAEDFEQPRDGEKHQFRLIIAPEDGAELDLTDYVRRLMVRVEADVRRPLEWAAVNHYDTGHPHAHLIIRGIGRDGQPVRLDRAYIANGLRWRAQELATEELGHRTPLDVARQRSAEVNQQRFTTLDRDIESHAIAERVDLTSLRRPAAEHDLLTQRLAHLASIGLAERTTATSWELKPDWQRQLRELSIQNDIIKQMHRALYGDPARYHVVRPDEPLPGSSAPTEGPVVGRVVAKQHVDELGGRFAAILETPDGSGYHVPLDPHSAETLRVGDLVTLKTNTVHGPAGPQRPNAPPAERQPSPKTRIFIDKQRPLVQQVHHRGPTWLDSIDPRTVSPHGLGADVARAASERRAALRQLGINPDDPKRIFPLRELERRTHGDRLAQTTGQRFLHRTPPTFRGRLTLTKVDELGRDYAVVSDGTQFVLVPGRKAYRLHVGRSVTLELDARGKPVLKKDQERQR